MGPEENEQPDEGSAKGGLFDLADADGVNESERILTALCRRSFLRLWSQTNVYTDDGFKEGKGATKELSDALVIFGKDVIIFSDKHVTFNAVKCVEVAWPRWYKKAVLESCRQLHGAKLWLERFPQRAFLDAKCTRPLPVAVPTEGVRFHLVAVTRGSREAVLAHNDGAGLGSFALNSSIEGKDHLDVPFVVGLPQPEKHFVHVFDEVSIELLLKELDTAADFLDYLKKREALLGRRGTEISAAGEEELLAAYLRSMDPTGFEHVFVPQQEGEDLPNLILFEPGIYEALNADPAYKRKKQADAVSYAWDQLIEQFLRYGDPASLGQQHVQDAESTERGLRLMASETRYRRRQLAQTFIGALERVERGMRLARLCDSRVAGETVYVFLVLAKRKDESYEDYRKRRAALLHAFVRTAKLRAPLGMTFVGLAFDNPRKDYRGGSEDLLVWAQDAWTAEDLAELEAMRAELGLWGDGMEHSRLRQDEFPAADQRVAIRRVEPAHEAATERQPNAKRKAEKRRRKAQDESKRKNRRKK